MTKAILQSYLTSFFGLVAGLPAIILGVFLPGSPLAFSAYWTHILMVTGGVGLVGLGVVAKAFNVHSTTGQAAASQAKAASDPNAPALVKAADKVAEGK